MNCTHGSTFQIIQDVCSTLTFPILTNQNILRLKVKNRFFNSFLEPFQAEVSDRTGRVTNIPVTIEKFTLLVGKNIIRRLNIVQTIGLQQVNRILRKPFWTKRTTENLS